MSPDPQIFFKPSPQVSAPPSLFCWRLRSDKIYSFENPFLSDVDRLKPQVHLCFEFGLTFRPGAPPSLGYALAFRVIHTLPNKWPSLVAGVFDDSFRGILLSPLPTSTSCPHNLLSVVVRVSVFCRTFIIFILWYPPPPQGACRFLFPVSTSSFVLRC